MDYYKKWDPDLRDKPGASLMGGQPITEEKEISRDYFQPTNATPRRYFVG